mmetsp:Transcript_3328/g.8618  ORF Transcript_3328/g.8618 Transcript_3328/m.8618 type:complete len:127 (+) Transcript_3328:93-473(+)
MSICDVIRNGVICVVQDAGRLLFVFNICMIKKHSIIKKSYRSAATLRSTASTRMRQLGGMNLPNAPSNISSTFNSPYSKSSSTFRGVMLVSASRASQPEPCTAMLLGNRAMAASTVLRAPLCPAAA